MNEVNIEVEGLVPLTKTQATILENVKAMDWKPNLSAISERTGIPISTIHDNWRRLSQQSEIALSIHLKPRKQ